MNQRVNRLLHNVSRTSFFLQNFIFSACKIQINICAIYRFVSCRRFWIVIFLHLSRCNFSVVFPLNFFVFENYLIRLRWEISIQVETLRSRFRFSFSSTAVKSFPIFFSRNENDFAWLNYVHALNDAAYVIWNTALA